MDFKRVHQSPSSRGSPLIQPLLNISKASTPVRTRVVANTGPLNSTPVNVNKIPQKNPIPSAQPGFTTVSHDGVDKENNSHNHRYGSTQSQNPNK